MSNIEIVKRFGEAVFEKDIETVKTLVDENYHFKGPMTEINGLEELIDFVQNMPMDAKEIKADYIAQGNKVVKDCTFNFTAPPIGEQDMCKILTLENGKITGAKLFYDTAPWPGPDEASEAA